MNNVSKSLLGIFFHFAWFNWKDGGDSSSMVVHLPIMAKVLGFTPWHCKNKNMSNQKLREQILKWSGDLVPRTAWLTYNGAEMQTKILSHTASAPIAIETLKSTTGYSKHSLLQCGLLLFPFLFPLSSLLPKGSSLPWICILMNISLPRNLLTPLYPCPPQAQIASSLHAREGLAIYSVHLFRGFWFLAGKSS